MKLLLLAGLVAYCGSVQAYYPMDHAHAYWPNQYGAEESDKWHADYNSCVRQVTEGEDGVLGRYHSIYSPADYAKHHEANEAIEQEFLNRYLQCIHNKGYTDIDH